MGVLYTSSDLVPALTALNRDYYGRNTWDRLYGQVGVQADTSMNQLNQSYERSLAEAYAASKQSEQALAGSQVGEGFKDLALNQNRQALQTAFEQYRQNYLQGVSDVNSAISSAVNEVTGLREDYTKNMTEYGNAHIGYLTWLYNQDNTLFDRIEYQRFMQDGALKSEDVLSGMIYDADGNLTTEGADILRQIRNNQELTGEYSFDNYLKQSNKELYDWAASYDEYNFTGKGTKAGTFQGLTGLDDTYNKRNSVSQETLDSNLSQFTNKYNEIYNAIGDLGGSHADVWNEGFAKINEQVGALKTALNTLGITAEEIGIDWDKFDSYVQQLVDIFDNPGDNQNDVWDNKKVVRKVAAQTYANAFKHLVNRVYSYFGGTYELKDPGGADISSNATNYANGVLIGRDFDFFTS